VSLHADATRVLGAWSAPDASAERLRRQLLTHLDTHPDAMQRSCWPAHVTATALVADPATSRVLLTLQRKVELWLPTGGHCEPGDATLGGAALREAREESGIEDLACSEEPVALDRHAGACRPGAVHLDVQYAAWAPPGALERISAESLDLRWFRPEALPERTDDAVRRLVSRVVTLRPDRRG